MVKCVRTFSYIKCSVRLKVFRRAENLIVDSAKFEAWTLSNGIIFESMYTVQYEMAYTLMVCHKPGAMAISARHTNVSNPISLCVS